MGLAVTTGIIIVFLMSLMLWRNSASYAEDGARVSSQQRLHGLDEYVRIVRDNKETED